MTPGLIWIGTLQDTSSWPPRRSLGQSLGQSLSQSLGAGIV